jgi:hypothetical protein
MIGQFGKHVRTHFVGYTALVLAMSGTAYAVGANSVGDRELAKNSVGSSEIEPDSVRSQDIEPDSIGAEQLKLGYGDGCGYVGQIIRVGFDFAPQGTLRANGDLLPVNQYSALFSLYGTTYGGDGVNDFRLPNLTANDGTSYLVCNAGVYPTRE